MKVNCFVSVVLNALVLGASSVVTAAKPTTSFNHTTWTEKILASSKAAKPKTFNSTGLSMVLAQKDRFLASATGLSDIGRLKETLLEKEMGRLRDNEWLDRDKILVSSAFKYNNQGHTIDKSELLAYAPGHHRRLQFTQEVAYFAQFIQTSTNCTGWNPYVEFGCSEGGTLEILGTTTRTTSEPICVEHPSLGASYALCADPDFPITQELDGIVFDFRVSFVCSGTSKAQVVGEAGVYPETELQCASEDQFAFVLINYFNLNVDPVEVVEDFDCKEGLFVTLDDEDQSSGCFTAATCDLTGCFLPQATARQNEPIPLSAFLAPSLPPPVPQPTAPPPVPAPVPPPVPPPAATELQSVGYRATFWQLSDETGCVGFAPSVEFGCLGGGELEVVSVTSYLNGTEPLCGDPADGFVTCTISTTATQEFVMDLIAVFICIGDSTDIVGEARILGDIVECPADDPTVASLVSVDYLELVNSTFIEDFTCLQGVVFELESGGSLCLVGGACVGGFCTLPEIGSRQNAPVPTDGIGSVTSPMTTDPLVTVPQPQPVPRPVPQPQPVPRPVPQPSPPSSTESSEGKPTSSNSGRSMVIPIVISALVATVVALFGGILYMCNKRSSNPSEKQSPVENSSGEEGGDSTTADRTITVMSSERGNSGEWSSAIPSSRLSGFATEPPPPPPIRSRAHHSVRLAAAPMSIGRINPKNALQDNDPVMVTAIAIDDSDSMLEDAMAARGAPSRTIRQSSGRYLEF